MLNYISWYSVDNQLVTINLIRRTFEVLRQHPAAFLSRCHNGGSDGSRGQHRGRHVLRCYPKVDQKETQASKVPMLFLLLYWADFVD